MATTDKYDRQLRLWGANGQKALSESRICLLNAGPTGTETLKNLVLPGCGYICVVDGNAVTDKDCENNFFVTRAHIGQPRAKAALELLLELNEDVAGSFRAESAASVIVSDPAFFGQFTLVVASQLSLSELQILAGILHADNIPLVAVRTYGLLGTVRVAVSEHRIVELKPQSAVDDLRVTAPFRGLREYVDGIDLDACDYTTHKHVPYLALLIKALDRFKAEHGGAGPVSFADKAAFKALLRAMGRPPPPDLRDDVEDNFTEAADKASLAYAAGAHVGVGDEVRRVLYDAAADTESLAAAIASGSSRAAAGGGGCGEHAAFWFVVRALRDFAEEARAAEHGGGQLQLPVAGDLPDMTATSDLYVGLQRIFQAAAAADAQDVLGRTQALVAAAAAAAAAAGSGSAAAGPAVDPAYVRLVCRNSRFLRVLRVHGMQGEAEWDEAARRGVHEELEAAVEAAADGGCAAELAPVVWYLALRAADTFAATHGGRHPGAALGDVAQLAADTAETAALLRRELDQADVPAGSALRAVVSDKHAQEIVRYGASEPQAVAALIGGVAAQEAVKLITHQYLPVNNTYVYSGVAGIAGSLCV